MISQFLQSFHQFLKRISNSNSCISLNIACKFKCYTSKSKLVLSECSDLYFIAIAFIAFTLHEIKQCSLFFGTPGTLLWMNRMPNVYEAHCRYKLSRKDGAPYQAVISWLRTRLSFEILRSVNIRARESRRPFKNADDFEDDFNVNTNAAEIF